MSQLTAEQVKEVVDRFNDVMSKGKLPAIIEKANASNSDDIADVSFGCFLCEGGLNVGAGALIAAFIAAGVVISPEAAVVVAIAGILSLPADAIVIILNGALAAGGAVAVEAIILELCQATGAC